MNAAQLAALRRQAGARHEHTAAPSISTAALPSACLRRRLGAPLATAASPPLPGCEIVSGLRLIEQRHDRVDLGPLQFDHGDLGLVDPQRLYALDTETTGLAGGAGTRAFLIGIANGEPGCWRVRQLLLQSLAAEGALLDTLARWLPADAVLLTYNGKSFDLPLLRTRLRLQRRDPTLLDRPHVDLLHAVRRRYRNTWPDCRQATAERELLCHSRQDDLPGSEAPAAYRRWLRGAETEPLAAVVRHNADDLAGLCRIAQRLSDDSRHLFAPTMRIGADRGGRVTPAPYRGVA